MENSNVYAFEKTERRNYCACNIAFSVSEPRVIILKTSRRIIFKNGFYVAAKLHRHLEMHESCYRNKYGFKGKFLEKQSEKGYKILIPIL